MERCGFPRQWVKWINFCISSVPYSVLVNGFPEGFLGNSRGIRQGDCLSLLLFVLVMQAFSKLMLKATEGGFILGFQERARDGRQLPISHLLFADDTLIFCGTNSEQIGYLRCIFCISMLFLD